MLRAIDGGLLLREFPLRPKIKERMVLAMFPIARCDKLVTKGRSHVSPQNETARNNPEPDPRGRQQTQRRDENPCRNYSMTTATPQRGLILPTALQDLANRGSVQEGRPQRLITDIPGNGAYDGQCLSESLTCRLAIVQL